MVIATVRGVQLTGAAALAPKSQLFGNYQELLNSGCVNAVSICTPPSTQREIAVAALQRGIHVLCEKPLAHTLEDAQEITRAAEESQACFIVAFRHRFLPAIAKIKQIVASGEIGESVIFTNAFCGIWRSSKAATQTQISDFGLSSLVLFISPGLDFLAELSPTLIRGIIGKPNHLQSAMRK